jgi:hypothetical protein
LKGKLERFTVFSDHEPAVSQIILKDRSGGKKRPILLEILNELGANPSIRVRLFGKNPAHRVLNKYIADLRLLGKSNSVFPTSLPSSDGGPV